MAFAGGQQEGTHPVDLLVRLDPRTQLSGPHAPDVHQVGAVGHQTVERCQGRLQIGEPRPSVERVRGAVHDAHHRRTTRVETPPPQDKSRQVLHAPTLPQSRPGRVILSNG